MDKLIFTRQCKPGNITLICGILLASLIPLCAALWVGGLSHLIFYDKLFYSRFIYWGTAGVLFLYARKIEHQPLLIQPENNHSVIFFIASVTGLYLLSLAVTVVSAIPILLGYHETDALMKKIILLLKGHEAMLFLIALTAAVTEELIFRGYILTRLVQLFKNRYIGIILSSILFAALHFKYNSFRELIFTFLVGIIFSLYYLKYRNIKALMVTHFLIDFINMNVAEHLQLK